MAPPWRRHVENACTRNEQERNLEEARSRRVKKKCSAVLALEKHMGWIRCGVCVCVCSKWPCKGAVCPGRMQPACDYYPVEADSWGHGVLGRRE